MLLSGFCALCMNECSVLRFERERGDKLWLRFYARLHLRFFVVAIRQSQSGYYGHIHIHTCVYVCSWVRS